MIESISLADMHHFRFLKRGILKLYVKAPWATLVPKKYNSDNKAIKKKALTTRFDNQAVKALNDFFL